MKKCFAAILAAMVLGLLRISAAAAEEPPSMEIWDEAIPAAGELFSSETDSFEDAEPAASPQSGQGEEGSGAPEDGEPEDPPEPEGYVPISPGLEKTGHPVYLRGSGDMVRPEALVTRGETACMIYSLLEAEPQPAGAASFSDVPPTAWYGPQVLALAEMGALNGYENGTFQPGRSITRGEFVGIISRFFAPWEDAPQAFADVEEGMWFWQEINAAAARGWINGYTDGTFRPGQKISRAEAAAILNRVLDRSGSQAKAKLDADGKVLLFLDLPFTHWAYYDVMEAALEHSHLENGQWESYTVPAAAHAPGYHLIDGWLYHVDGEGRWTRNQAAGVQEFDNNGRYSTGSPDLDQRLADIVAANTVSGAGAQENFQRLHLYVTQHFTYRAGSFIPEGTSGWEENLALEMARNRWGNCYRFAALDAMLARWMGYQAQGVSGQIDTGNGFVPHGWVQIEEDGKTYLCDPEIQYVRPDWDLFLKPYSAVLPDYMVSGKHCG